MLYSGYGIQDRLRNIMFANASKLFGLESWRTVNVQKLIHQLNISSPGPKQVEGAGMERGGLVVEPRTPEREVGVRPAPGAPCFFLEQDAFTPQKHW